MAARKNWTRDDMLIAFYLYTQIPFGQFHDKNPTLIEVAQKMGRSTGSLAMKLSNIASVDPTFRASGRTGLANASQADRDMWEEMSSDWSNFATISQEAFKKLKAATPMLYDEPINVEADTNYSGETRETTIKQRVGQQFFRKAVLSAYNQKCCITGLAIPSLLVASHIRPWADEPTQRLNPRNGLCLNVLHDKAFDRYMISLDDDFRVVISNRIKKESNPFLIATIFESEGRQIQLPEKFMPDQMYIACHRDTMHRRDTASI